MRFRLIDQVIEHSERRLVGIKVVSVAEEYLADHFPGFAVLPGVMMLEALTQAGRLLAAGRSLGASEKPNRSPDERELWQEADQRPLILAEARNIRYSNMVRPGQALRVEVTLRDQDDDGCTLDGVGSVADDVVVQGRLRLAPLAGGS